MPSPNTPLNSPTPIEQHVISPPQPEAGPDFSLDFPGTTSILDTSTERIAEFHQRSDLLHTPPSVLECSSSSSTSIPVLPVGAQRTACAETSPPQPLFTSLTDERKDKLILQLLKQNQQLRRSNAAMKMKLKRLDNHHHNFDKRLRQRFGKDQLDVLARGCARGRKWSPATVQKGIQLPFACGTRGYKEVSSLQMPLPSTRTLRERVQHIKFEPGILTEVLDALIPKVQEMPEEERDCVLCFDEMSLHQARNFDKSTNKYIGHCTIPPSNHNAVNLSGNELSLASKVMVFIRVSLKKIIEKFKLVNLLDFCMWLENKHILFLTKTKNV